MQSGNFVEFVGVQKSYDGRNIVIRDLDLGVRQGEFLTLLGGSGSGKTTTLMMLAGFERPTSGHILVNGAPIEHLPPHRRGIGVVFQNYALFPHMTVAQNLAYPLRMRRASGEDIRGKVARAIEMVRLGGMEDRRPSELSGGQQQRVALARALVFEPQLVLMDEPLGALDKNLREHMQYEIKQIHRDLGITMVYVTHDQTEALAMSDRIAIFEGGVIAQIDSPRKLYEEPANLYVANFIGENNILAGHATERDASGNIVVQLESGHHLRCSDSGNVKVPGPVKLAVRPEHLRIGPEAGQSVNQCTGKIMDITYLGDHLRALVDLGGGQTMILRQPFSAFETPPEAGQSVVMGWNETDGRLFANGI